MTDSTCNFERGFQLGFRHGLMAGAAGLKPDIIYADADLSRRFGVALGARVKVYYGDDGEIIGAIAA